MLKASSYAFLHNMFPLSGEDGSYLTIVAIQNWYNKRKREMHLYFSFPFEFCKFCKTGQLHVIIETLLYMFRMCSALF